MYIKSLIFLILFRGLLLYKQISYHIISSYQSKYKQSKITSIPIGKYTGAVSKLHYTIIVLELK